MYYQLVGGQIIDPNMKGAISFKVRDQAPNNGVLLGINRLCHAVLRHEKGVVAFHAVFLNFDY